ncbi:MbnP family protein [Owenweeksia hongkongensis]|uniref:MbnP family protein n=1 Tax=Owenweeksia hongkongensis TaxID=253245 RepID=UPI003A9225FF
MKTLKTFSVAVLALIIGLSSCKEDKKEELNPDKMVKLKFAIMDGNNQMALGDDVKLTTGFDFKLQLLRMYVSDITLTEDDGTLHLVKGVDILSPVKNDDNTTTLNVPYGNYTSIKIGYGVDAEQNLSDPTSFSQNHPLSNYQSMYWPMINYRFVKLEGQSTQTSTSTDYLVSIHPGKDALYQIREYDFSSDLEVNSSSTQELLIQFDINDIFDGSAGVIDFSKEGANQVHMVGALDDLIGERFMINLADATKLEVVQPAQ